MTGFNLYKKQTPTFPFEDYGALMEEVKSLGAKSCIEFGPGTSTLALIESGLERIVTCEHDNKWREAAETKFKQYPQVEVTSYRNDPTATCNVTGQFDMAFVDSPKGYHPARIIHPGQEDCSRLNTCLLALEHAPVVYLHDALRPLERGSLSRLNAMGHKVTLMPPRLAKIERKQ